MHSLIPVCETYARAVRPALPNAFVLEKAVSTDFEATMYSPVICLILRGAKETWSGDHCARPTAGDALLVSHHVPVRSRIIGAGLTQTYLALVLQLDLRLMRGLYEQVADHLPPTRDATPLLVKTPDKSVIDVLGRYMALAENPLDAAVLGPQVLQEIHYRLLMSDMGAMLRDLMTVDSHASRVAKAIGVIRSRYGSPIAINPLAADVGMSPSSFHTHFKHITGTTPLQYIKDVRLIAARDLLRTQDESVSAVSYAVGYESPTHFSRDFARKFGQPPSRARG